LSVIPLNTLSVSNDLMGPIDSLPAPLKDEDRNCVNADDHRRNSDKTNVRERIPGGYDKERPRNSVKQPDPMLKEPRKRHPHQAAQDPYCLQKLNRQLPLME
jgi:hypothetical protein